MFEGDRREINNVEVIHQNSVIAKLPDVVARQK